MTGRRLGRTVTLLAGAMLSTAAPAAAQDGSLAELTPTGLLRMGFGLEPESSITHDGFLVYDARVGLTGKVGFVFDYEFGVEYSRRADRFELLDAVLSFPIGRSSTHVDVGGFRSPFGREATTDKAALPFVERSQAALSLAPGRQLGAQIRGEALDARLHWAAGLFNGNGVRLENDGDGFLGAARVSFNSVGEVEFFEDFVFEAGLSLAVAGEASADLLPQAVGSRFALVAFTGDRTIYGGDARLAYLGWLLAAEYSRAEFDDPMTPERIHADGWTVDLRHALWGAFDLGARYDGFRPAVRVGPGADRNDFLVLGLNVSPGLYARVGLQYAIGLDGTIQGAQRSIDFTSTAPPLSDGQFLMFLQVAF